MTDPKPDLRLVPSLAQRRGEMIGEIDNGNLDPVDLRNSYPELAGEVGKAIKTYGKGKSVKVRGRRRPKAEPEQPTAIPEEIQPIKTVPPGTRWLAWLMRGLGAGFGAIGFALNCGYAWQAGAEPWQKLLWSSIGGLTDLVAMSGLALVSALRLWHQRLPAFMIWAVAVAYSFAAGLGFTTSTLNEQARNHAQAEQYGGALAAQLARAEDALAHMREPKDIDADIQTELDRLSKTREWGTSKGCTADTTSQGICERLKQLRHERDGEAGRSPLIDRIDHLTREIATQKTISDPDTAAEQLGTAAYYIRRFFPALMIAFSCFLFWFSRGLRDATPRHD